MRRNNKLDFSANYKRNKGKRVRSFILAFILFVIVLGTASVLMFMKSINFDLSNLLSAAQTTTGADETTETTEPALLSGQRRLLVSFEDSDGKLNYAFAVVVSFDERLMTVYSAPVSATGEYNGVAAALSEQYKKYGPKGLKEAAEQAFGIKFDRYICANEAALKSFLGMFDDITVEIPEALDGRTSDGLILDKGAQSLPAEMFVKYLNYCSSEQKARSFASLLRTVFSEENADRLQKYFSFIANNSKTDITIVDFSADKSMLEAFSEEGGKIYVGSDVGKTDEVVYEEGS